MTRAPVVLIVEDEPQTRRFLRPVLKGRGFDIVEAENGQQGIKEAAYRNPEIILLDLGLPDLDGVEVIRRLREWSIVPIIVLSVRDREEEKIEALDSGADDYLTKPFGAGELLARIRVALRKKSRGGSDTMSSPLFAVGALRVDLSRRRVTVSEEEIHLTPTEYQLLSVLVRAAGRVVTHEALLSEVWGTAYAGHTQYLRVFMAQLRRKVEPDQVRPRYLTTEPGIGYRLRSD
jgi:two-component system, OmpR family, KDP operon response regulator KdpE